MDAVRRVARIRWVECKNVSCACQLNFKRWSVDGISGPAVAFFHGNCNKERMARQKSIPNFTDEENALIEEAMRLTHSRAKGDWIRSAVLNWATQIIAQDKGLVDRVFESVPPAAKKPRR